MFVTECDVCPCSKEYFSSLLAVALRGFRGEIWWNVSGDGWNKEGCVRGSDGSKDGDRSE